MNNIKVYKISYGTLNKVIKKEKIEISLYSPLTLEHVKLRMEQDKKVEEVHINSLVNTIAHPTSKIIMRFGGGTSSNSEQVVCIDGKHTVGVVFNNDEVLILEYRDSKSLADTYIINYASKSEVVAPNHIPPLCSIEEFSCILHSIDLYRREYYSGMLSYNRQHAMGFALTTFSDHFDKSIISKDTRWLLPCFMMIVPNLELKKIKMNKESLNILIDNGLCQMMKNDDNNTFGLYFTPDGKEMGLEFERTWLTSVGLEFSKYVNQEIKVLSRSFIATTALANHFVDIKADGDQLMINHQSFHYNQLHKKLSDLIEEVI